MYILTIMAIGAGVGVLAHWLFERANEPVTSVVVGAVGALLGNQLWGSLGSKVGPSELTSPAVFWSLLTAAIFNRQRPYTSKEIAQPCALVSLIL